MSYFATRYGGVSVHLEDGSIYIETRGDNSQMGLQLSLDEARMIAKAMLNYVINAEPNRPPKLCELEADLEYLEHMRGHIEMWIRSIKVNKPKVPLELDTVF